MGHCDNPTAPSVVSLNPFNFLRSTVAIDTVKALISDVTETAVVSACWSVLQLYC